MEQQLINIVPEGSAKIYHVSEGDEGRQIQLDLTEALTGTEALTIRYRKPNGEAGAVPVPSTSGSSVTATVPAEMTSAQGFTYCKLRINGIGAKSFFVKVERRP